jgi:hypothetical protein
MTRESKIICRNQFKSADEETRKAEFKRKLALLISRMENQSPGSGEKITPMETQDCFNK